MIISRAPVRITLGGGGTDLESYYSKHGGFLIAGALNKYCSILANKRFQDNIRLSYSETEIVDKVADIQHRIFRAALEFVGIEKGIELHSSADVPASCGLGTSSSFTVALLNALHTHKRDFVNQKQLAEEACHWYKRRYRIETLFSDKKSRGFHIDKSHLSQPARLARLLVASSLAYIWMIYLGLSVIQEGCTDLIDRVDRTDKSLFRLGLDWLDYLLKWEKPFSVQFFVPPYSLFANLENVR